MVKSKDFGKDNIQIMTYHKGDKTRGIRSKNSPSFELKLRVTGQFFGPPPHTNSTS